MSVDVARLRALLKRGTPSYEGPPRAHDVLIRGSRQIRMWSADGRYVTPTDDDRELLCEALAHLPALLDEVERLRRWKSSIAKQVDVMLEDGQAHQRAEEREACAQVASAEVFAAIHESPDPSPGYISDRVVDAIRARGKNND